MIIPPSGHSAPSVGDAILIPIIANAGQSIHPTSRRTDSISLLLPLIITAVFLLILAMTGLLARCLYRRFKALHISPSSSSTSWKNYYSTRPPGSNSAHDNSSYNHYNDDLEESDDPQGEQERLLARRRSTSYYDANRSRAPVAVVIKQDSKGRPISTWSTASSVAAQRGEELSQWSRRRDDLIKIYGRSQLNTSSFADHTDDLEEDPEQEELEDEQDERHYGQGQGQELGQDQEQATRAEEHAKELGSVTMDSSAVSN
ncbi:hypothetical protein BGZ98_000589 [Dissophora globulifera]|nr:hypothetical protein BGZ98_000589 [Dissophora globulifera]